MSVDMKEREKEAMRLAEVFGCGWTKREVTPHTSIFHITMTLEEAQHLEKRLAQRPDPDGMPQSERWGH